MRWFTKAAAWILPLLAGGLGAVSVVLWLTHDPVADLVLNVPGLDGAPAALERAETVAIGEYFRAGDGHPSDVPGSWPNFRGAGSRNISTETIALASRWDADQPKVLWQIKLGEGHAGAAIHRGRVYVLDYDETARLDVLRCLSFDDGREIWQRGYRVEVPRNHGMSRTVPAVSDRHVVTLGPRCHVMAVDAENGDLRWGIDMVEAFGTRVPMWYAGQCPLIVDNTAILAPAGSEVLMMGVDCDTGKILWKTPNTHGLDMSHASIVPTEIHGVRMFIYAGLGGMVGVAADGDRTGEILWFAPQWDRSVIAPSPIHLGDGRLFVTAGYGGGSMMLKIQREGDAFRVETLAPFGPRDALASEQQTPVLADGLLFGILPNDAGPLRNQLVCIDPGNMQTFVWTSGRERRFGLGPYLVADGKLFVLSDDGILHMLELSADGYNELGRRQIIDGHDAWGPMALAGGRLILRDDTRMVCVDLR